MVSKAPQEEDDEHKMRQDSATQIPSKALVKETHKEGIEIRTPRQPKKEGHAPSKAQDVAELKDYVRSHLLTAPPMS